MRVVAVALAVALWAGPLLAEAPRRSPRPELNPKFQAVAAVSTMSGSLVVSPLRPIARPMQEGDPLPVEPMAAMRAGLPGHSLPLDVVPRPPARPEGGQAGARVETAAYKANPGREVIVGRKGSVCGDPAIKGKTIPPIKATMRGCGLSEGVEVTSIDGVSLSAPAKIDCATALSLRAWVTEGLKPAVGKRGGGVDQMVVAGSYTCRPRNNQPGNKISEHGRGKALDVSGFVLKDGEVITVARNWGRGKQGEILAAMHYLACNSFGTVLGPGANRFHHDHFHFDTARKTSSYCR